MKERFQKLLPTVGKSWIYVLVFLLGSMVLGVVLSPLVPYITPVKMSFLYICSFLPVFLMMFLETNPKYELFTSKPSLAINKPSFGAVNPVALFAMLLVATICIAFFTEPVTKLMEMPEALKQVFETAFGGQAVDTFISVCILAPLLEEFFCRGILLRGMLTHISPAKAIAWSAFIFAVMHGNPFQGIPAFLLGCFFGWVYYRTRCIYATIFMHFVNNTASMVLTWSFPDLPPEAGFADIVPESLYIPLIIASFVVFAAIVYILYKKLAHSIFVPVPAQTNEIEETISDQI